MRRDSRLSLEQTKRISRARLLGQRRSVSIFLEDHELAKLLGVIERDVGPVGLLRNLPDEARPASRYYGMSSSWFTESISVPDFAALYLEATEKIGDLETFLNAFASCTKGVGNTMPSSRHKLFPPCSRSPPDRCWSSAPFRPRRSRLGSSGENGSMTLTTDLRRRLAIFLSRSWRVL